MIVFIKMQSTEYQLNGAGWFKFRNDDDDHHFAEKYTKFTDFYFYKQVFFCSFLSTHQINQFDCQLILCRFTGMLIESFTEN